MRDRLIEILKKSGASFENALPEEIADYILGKGVIVPPMKLGQTCYMPWISRNDINECRVSSITQKADGTFKIRLTNLRGRYVFEIIPDEIGKTIFLTRSEAEQALAERRENE